MHKSLTRCNQPLIIVKKSNAAIWFNKVCRSEQLTPSYIDIKIGGNNERSHKTKNAATKHRINTELKFLYKKKSTLNQLLYNTHLDCANYWKEMWFLIYEGLTMMRG
jgi:hypothetical protein